MRLFITIFLAIIAAAVVIGGVLAINEADKQRRISAVNHEIATEELLSLRRQTISTVSMLSAFNSSPESQRLYDEWLKVSHDGTTEQQTAKLDELERKLKVINPALAQYFIH